MDKWSPRTWHRKASRPVSLWMMVFLIAGATHTLIPNYRWVLIHLFTLGILSNSIVVWSQHLTEKFVQIKVPLSARPRQLARIYLLNTGAIFTLVGQTLVEAWEWHWLLTQVGAALVATAVAWHGVALFALWRQAESKRFRPVVAAYVASAFFLAVGATLGAFLATHPSHPRLLVAHVAANIGGFVGLAAAGSLTILFPSIWRTKGINPRMSLNFTLLGLGVLATLVGSIWNVPQVGLILYCLGWALSLQGWLVNALTVVRDPRGRITFPALSVLFSSFWLLGGLVYYTTQHFFSSEPKIPMLALVVGFGAQLLIGVMGYMLPTTMGGGPSAVRAGLREYNRWGLGRSAFVNGGLALWLATSNSLIMVAASLLCLGSMAIFPILTARAVKAQKAVLLKKAEGPAPTSTTDWDQAWVALAVLLILGGLSLIL
ncbi:copper oxidase [Corynebacterium aurimucosum]|uniref:Copper oxidase n=1 Tax=Corynebacterium aurimucosum TaxID=169292 RepID=A0A558ISJ8_9CORY|nr:copper oxidase [Corynebacterium aurimucosum]TVU84367.1 copper oxidase [Corynebacterium aurimucosum]